MHNNNNYYYNNNGPHINNSKKRVPPGILIKCITQVGYHKASLAISYSNNLLF